MKNTLNPLMQAYLKRLVLATLILAAVSVLGHIWLPNIVHSFWYVELLFVVVVTYFVFAYLQKFKQEKAQRVIAKYQSIKMLKLLVFLAFLAIYVFLVKTEAFQFLICFMIYYTVFTIIETVSLQSWLKNLAKE